MAVPRERDPLRPLARQRGDRLRRVLLELPRRRRAGRALPRLEQRPRRHGADGCSIAGDTTAGQFNTYALSWTPTTITTYFNGVPCITDVYGPYVTSPDTAPEPFNQPFFLAFTSAFGMNGNDSFEPGTTPLPATMKIDWVRVWQY